MTLQKDMHIGTRKADERQAVCSVPPRSSRRSSCRAGSGSRRARSSGSGRYGFVRSPKGRRTSEPPGVRKRSPEVIFKEKMGDVVNRHKDDCGRLQPVGVVNGVSNARIPISYAPRMRGVVRLRADILARRGRAEHGLRRAALVGGCGQVHLLQDQTQRRSVVSRSMTAPPMTVAPKVTSCRPGSRSASPAASCSRRCGAAGSRR